MGTRPFGVGLGPPGGGSSGRARLPAPPQPTDRRNRPAPVLMFTRNWSK